MSGWIHPHSGGRRGGGQARRHINPPADKFCSRNRQDYDLLGLQLALGPSALAPLLDLPKERNEQRYSCAHVPLSRTTTEKGVPLTDRSEERSVNSPFMLVGEVQHC